jgi:catechol 2,3-dioxygenase
VIGLALRDRGDSLATLASGDEDLVVLHEHRTARRAQREAGAYHAALLFPTRDELGRAAARPVASATPISGASDHGHH